MLALAAANVVGVVLFGTLFAVAGIGYLSALAYRTFLVGLFALVTALWMRTEARHRHVAPLRRFGRGFLGLVAVVVGAPAFILSPLFWLDTQLPGEAGVDQVLAPAMAAVLFSLVLVGLANLVGSLVIVARAFMARWHLRRRS